MWKFICSKFLLICLYFTINFMGIINREGSLYLATGIDNSGLYAGRREAMGIIKAMAGQITSFDVFSGIGISAATAFASAAKSSYDFEKEFQKNMLEVATISTQVEGSMTDFMNQVMAITQEIPIKAPEAAKALYQIVSAGHDGADGMKVLEVSARSAIGGMTDTATAADAITTLINAYKLSADDAEKVSDQLFTTARLGKTTFGELGQSIAQVAPIAASYGVEMDQVLAAVATLTKSGTPTAQAMTQIRASIIGASKVLGDGAFNTRTFQEGLAEIAARAGGSESKLRELIPEVEAVNGVLGLTGIKAQDAAEHLKAMNESAGSTEAAFKLMMNDVDKQMTLLSNNIQTTLRPMGETILKNVSEAAKTINHGFETGDVQNSMENLKKLLIGVAGAYVTYKSSVIGASAAEAFHSAKVSISNNLKTIQNTITGESIIAKEKERLYQEAYNASLEKTITEEQRAKLSKMNLKAGSEEYIKALADQAMQEKKNADNLVESLTKQVEANKVKLASAKEKLDISKKSVEAAKAEFDAAFEAKDLAALEVAQTKLNAAAKREEAAATNVSVSAKKLKSAESKLLTASINAENAATRINTATTVANTAATNVATGAKNRLKVATVALWRAMKANPLGAILTMISLATTAYMLFADKINAAETAQSRLNKLQKATADNMANEQAELRLLLSVAKNELISKEDREKAIKKLNDISPEYLGNLSLENLKTQEAMNSIDAYTKSIEKNAKMKAAQDMVVDKQKRINELNMEIAAEQRWYDKSKSGTDTKRIHGDKLFRLIDEKKTLQGDIDQILSFAQDQAEKKPVSIPVNVQLETEQANLSALMDKKEEIEAKIKGNQDKGLLVNAFDITQLNVVNDELKKTNDHLISLNKEASKKTEDEGETVLQRKIDLTNELAKAEAELKKLRAPDSKATQNEINAAQTNIETIKGKLKALTGITEKEGGKLKQAQVDLARSILDNELKLQADRIAIMKDGKDKRVLLADQEYKETIAAIQKEKEEYQKKVKESGGKENPAVLSTFTDRENSAKDKRNNDVANIAKDYSDQLKSIQNDVDSHFRSQLDNRLIEIDSYYKEQIKIAKEAGEEEEGDFIQMLIRKQQAEREYARKESALSTVDFKEQVDLGHLENKSNDTYFVEETERQKTEIVRKYALERITILDSMGDEQSKKDAELLRIAVEGYDKALSKPSKKSINNLIDEKAIKALQKRFMDLGMSEEEAKEKAIEYAEGFKGKMQMVADVADSLKTAFGGISDELDMALDAVSNIAQGFAEGGLIGGISAAAGQLVSVVSNLFTAKKEIDKSMVEGYETYMDAINDLIDTQVALLDKLGGMAFGQNIIDTTKDIAKSIAASRTLFNEAMRAGSGMFSHSDGYKANKMLKGYVNELREVGIYTTDLSRMTNEQLASLKKLPEVYARLPEGLRKYIDAIAEGIDKTEEFKDQIQDTVLGLDFTSITDMIVNSVTDPSIDNALEELEVNIDKTIASIAQNMLRRNMLLGPLEKMTNDLYKSMEKKDKDGNTYYKLTAESAKSFKDNVLGLGKQFQDAWKELEEAFSSSGIDLMPKDQETTEDVSDNSLKGAYAKANQESIDLLAGQTGAQRVAIESIREQMQFIRDLQVQGWKDVTAIKELVGKLKEVSDKIYDAVDEIKGHTGELSEYSERTVNAVEGTLNVKVKM